MVVPELDGKRPAAFLVRVQKLSQLFKTLRVVL